MANTNTLKDVEQHVRRWSLKKYGIQFHNREKEINLSSGGVHRFDVVAKDGSIVAGIKTSALRDNGTVGAGVIKSTYTELYFLSLVKATKKLMILTVAGYCKYFRKKSKGKVAKGVEIIHCPLPKAVRGNVANVHKNCRKEIGKK